MICSMVTSDIYNSIHGVITGKSSNIFKVAFCTSCQPHIFLWMYMYIVFIYICIYTHILLSVYIYILYYIYYRKSLNICTSKHPFTTFKVGCAPKHPHPYWPCLIFCLKRKITSPLGEMGFAFLVSPTSPKNMFARISRVWTIHCNI